MPPQNDGGLTARKRRRMFRAVAARSPMPNDAQASAHPSHGGRMDPAEKEFLLTLYGKLWDDL
jgi:hypothetical protein